VADADNREYGDQGKLHGITVTGQPLNTDYQRNGDE
jgi:hypothetical protein